MTTFLDDWKRTPFWSGLLLGRGVQKSEQRVTPTEKSETTEAIRVCHVVGSMDGVAGRSLMAKPRIMMVCEAFGGGVYAYVSQLCNDMSSSFDVTLVWAERPQTPKSWRSEIDQRVQLIQLDEMSDRSLFGIKRSIGLLRRIKAQVQPDIIHLHSSIAGGLGRLAFDGTDCPVVYTPHGYAHVLMGPGLKSSLYHLLERYLGRKDCITLTCCESEDEEAQKLCRRTAYIETGVNLYELSRELDGVEPTKSERFTVFTLGRASKQKRPGLFNRIAELVPEADFLWIGSGELERELTAPNITVTGWKPRYEALAIAKGADAFVLCSYGEAIAMSLIENMYIEKLVLVSNVMGNRSVVRDGVNGYVCDDPEDYALRIRGAMQNFPKALPERAHQDVLDVYNSEVMSRKYVEFYGALVRPNNRVTRVGNCGR